MYIISGQCFGVSGQYSTLIPMPYFIMSIGICLLSHYCVHGFIKYLVEKIVRFPGFSGEVQTFVFCKWTMVWNLIIFHFPPAIEYILF